MSKSIIITGISSGIGLASAVKLHSEGHRVTGLIRDIPKGEKLKTEGQLPEEVELIECDLADLSSVSKAIGEVKARHTTIDVLINNAGGVFPRQKTSADGFEMTFAVNHLGHFALTTSLLDILLPSKARVINVSSEAHRTGKLKIENLKPSNSYRSWGAYGTAKLCNIYFTTELHRRFASEGLTSYALHPGVVNTHFFTPFKGIIGFLIRTFSFLLISPEKGAETQIFLATAPDLKEQSGEYFKNKKVKKPSSQARNSAAAKKLWEVSEQYLKEAGTK